MLKLYCYSHAYYLFRFLRNSVGFFFFFFIFLRIFFKNFGCVFSTPNTFLVISQEWLVELMWNKKEVHQLDIWYTMWLWTLNLTHDLDLWCCLVKFWNSCISGVVGLIDLKWKGSELIRYWADLMNLPFDLTHDLDLEVSRSEFEIALSQEWDGQLNRTKRMWVVHSWPWYWL